MMSGCLIHGRFDVLPQRITDIGDTHRVSSVFFIVRNGDDDNDHYEYSCNETMVFAYGLSEVVGDYNNHDDVVAVLRQELGVKS